MNADTAKRILNKCLTKDLYFQSLLEDLITTETPPREPGSHLELINIIRKPLEEVGYLCTHYPGTISGGQLYARKPGRSNHGYQLLLGHLDTVWPFETIHDMPFTLSEDVISGPGSYDMKAGITMMITALQVLNDLSLEPVVKPVLFINSDEETGSHDSKVRIKRLAGVMKRVYVLEPSLDHDGKIKTRRKGIGHFSVKIKGVSSHAGLAPEKGRSAILALSFIIQKLFNMNDPAQGITINVGTINGGIGTNVVAPESTAAVDVRVLDEVNAQIIEQKIRSLDSSMDGISVEIEGGFGRPPMEQNQRNRELWEKAVKYGTLIGLKLDQGTSGGGSDGNFTSQITATLDGLGAVGEGAHSKNEQIYIQKTLERTALLSLLLMAE
ncbi:M20 family metallopeptidase [Balneola sp. MJW-20]|uniref:M20 family metallopeptidase n=1 Tax=Gracilimonas aurantiaca TaxID=3234185 RepID=UPI003465CC1E